MTMNDIATLSLLGDSALTVVDADEDIRGRTVGWRRPAEPGEVRQRRSSWIPE